MVEGFLARGWHRFPHDTRTAAWAAAALAPARAAIADPALRDRWLTCEGTWFVGVDALPNDPGGAISGTPLAGAALDAIRGMGGPLDALHPAQVSAVWPGYPRPRAGESMAAFRYRQTRDAAHVDGIRKGPDGARRLEEPHAFILGLPLTDSPPEAAPLVVWEGSHRIMAEAFSRAFAGDGDPRDRDITALYTETRAEVFRTCRRVALPARPGEALLIHRLTLHGIAPWSAKATDPGPRITAYFRPELATPTSWAQLDP